MSVMTYREAVARGLREEMRRDKNVYILGEEVGVWGGAYAVTRGFLDEFGPERVRDTPIAEMAIAGCAIGSAMMGMKPVAELMTINFAILALDQIGNHAAKLHHMFNGQITCPIVVRTAAGWGQLAATHSQSLEVWFAHLPGLKVVMPGTPADACGLIKAAIRDPDPVVFIENSKLYNRKDEVPDAEYLLPIGKSDIKRRGRHITLVSWGRMIHETLDAAEQLKAEGVEAEVIDLRTLRPLDFEPVAASVRKTNRAVIVEEGWLSFGVGAELAARIQEECFDHLDAPVGRVAALEVPLPYSKPLEAMCIPGAPQIIAAAKKTLYRG
ncbi:MAG: 2-oxoisovalerate dehydrogenase subunit beta [Myxococcota bacterium]|nr:2-oxoisovalerate dehydrogenase subunit beta [Myxococcota bacterium]